MMRWMLVPVLGLALVAAGCAPLSKPPILAPQLKTKKSLKLNVVQVTFDRLSGWADDQQGFALGAFQRSCKKLMTLPAERTLSVKGGVPAGQVKNWQGACAAAKPLDIQNHNAARRFFETWFVPYAVRDKVSDQPGLFTGYYEPQMKGSLTQGGIYQTPLLARPSDLISVNLESFDANLGGNTVWGRIQNGRLVPYPDRRAIENGSLQSVTKPVLWVASNVDAFFLHVQGSGQVILSDGQIVRVGFAGKNGRPYKSIGRILIDRHEISADHLTMDAIRKWVETRPVDGPKLLQQNPSYIFFRVLKGAGPIGAQGVALTPERSLAIDRRFLPLGVPVWLETKDPLNQQKPFQKLMVAQDTGGAIKGVVRGDIFFGAGKMATKRAGNMKRAGRYFVLLPQSVFVW